MKESIIVKNLNSLKDMKISNIKPLIVLLVNLLV